MNNIKNKNALITGASKGIGRAISIELAKQGVNVAINYNKSKKEAEKISNELINEYNVKSIILKGDVSNKDDCSLIVQESISTFGTLDILVNNAGIIDDNLLIRMSDEAWDRVLRTNLDSIFYCSKPAIKSMLKKKWGRILNIGSVVGIRGNIGQANYASSKAGMMGFTKSLAKEVATRNITVNTITPGYINTETVDVLKQEQKDNIMKWIPQGHFGEVEDIAYLASFLCSEKAKYITGQIISVDGGMAI
ncbi:MAG: 3-oxoacyl-[acyl-carrier-protein] reductase [SAR202 cluster bacterium]|nr:3-oxoacyl-[acyl-carrier-protein] reductase [SAR202 cluster bacterium]|tara:strand:- start:1949 stop:2698 length:750 start_codon:yes stop_codon:yes gene_type:complete